jgi:hemolysin activation/secretion protein
MSQAIRSCLSYSGDVAADMSVLVTIRRQAIVATITAVLTVQFSESLAQEQNVDEPVDRGDRGITITSDQAGDDETVSTVQPDESMENVLPPLPTQLPAPAYTNADQIVISRVVLDGNTVLPQEEVTQLISAFDNRHATIDELQELRYQLSELYVKHGYVSSGVVLPDQRVDDNVIRLLAIEGTLTNVSISGNRSLYNSYIEKRIRRGAGVPLNTTDLQRALKILQSDPRIAQINAKLLPGAKAGESVLHVDVVENVTHWVISAVDNYRSPSVDENRVSLSAGNGNFVGFGDVLSIDFGVTEGLDNLDASYSVPLTATDLRLAGYYQSTDANVVEEPFDIIDIKSESETFGIALSRPFRRDSGTVVTAILGLENRQAENWLLGMPFSFTPGEQNGSSEVSVAYLTAETVWQSAKQIIGLTVTGRVGVDLFEPTINETGPDSTFTAFRAQFQYARVLGWRNSQFIIRSSAQITSDPLLALEKFAVGGHTTVRGYRENQLVRDNGFVTSVELPFPLIVDDEGRDTLGLLITPFIDYGVAWDNDNGLQTSDKDDIVSIGLGLRWQPTANWSIWADYGYALTDVRTPTESLQDRGFQFRVEYRVTPRGRF